MNMREVLYYLASRELDTNELKKLIKELDFLVYSRENIPF